MITDTQDTTALLSNIQQLVATDFNQLDHLLQEQLKSKIPFIQEVIQYIINSGGKRLRPLVVILSARAAGTQGNREYLELATVIEFIHTATLLHDDVVDESRMRRGRQTANERWGNHSSILVGDFLYSRAFQVLATRSNVPVMKVLANATNIIAEGEVLQLLNIADLELTQARYINVIQYKTAMLFEAASHIGALLGNLNPTQINALRLYGRNLGIAFQIADDVLDYSADIHLLGKSVGDDLSEGKLTLPLIFALKQCGVSDKKMIANVLQQDEIVTTEQLLDIIQVIKKTNASEQALTVAESYTKAAIDHLQFVPSSKYQQALIDLAQFAIARNY